MKGAGMVFVGVSMPVAMKAALEQGRKEYSFRSVGEFVRFAIAERLDQMGIKFSGAPNEPTEKALFEAPILVIEDDPEDPAPLLAIAPDPAPEGNGLLPGTPIIRPKKRPAKLKPPKIPDIPIHTRKPRPKKGVKQ